jgi:predicted outer membrane repeat protein
VFVYSNSTFTMSGGTISSNTAGGQGGGVYVSGTFTRSGGTVSRQTAGSGGGVNVYGTFTMVGLTFSGNTCSGGGGVYVSSGTFTMSDGTISGNNTAEYNGGGVSVYNGTFTKSGGTIYGSDAADGLKNTATLDGHAVYVYSSSSPGKKRNTTAEEGVKLYAKFVSGAWTYNDTSEGGVGDTTANWQ